MLDRQVKHLGRIVDDLLDVTRDHAGQDRTAAGAGGPRPPRPGRGRRPPGRDRRRGRLEAVADVPGEPVLVRGDRTRLAQVVGNLLQNAAKFTDPGGRVAVRLSVDRTTQQAVLDVEDTGIGIEAELLPRVFEMFSQADRTLDRSRGGLGLGLALVKGLVELHGGRATAASEGPGKGARFTCRLPLDGDGVASPEAAAEPAGTKPLRVLVIEDSRDGAESLRMLLSLSGHEVRVAHTGPSGVDAAKEFRPAVVLCDIGLPGGMSGYDVARALRQDPATAPARLIAVSGYGQPEDQAKARAAGFDLHLTKPADPNDLQRRLASE